MADLQIPNRLMFPRTRELQVAAVHYRERFAAYAIQPRDILIQLPNRRLYIGRYLQEFLAGIHVEWQERLTRRTLGVRHVLEAGDTLPPFPTATADTLGAMGPGLGGEPLKMGRNGQGGTAGGAMENRQDHGEQGRHVRKTSGDPPDTTQRSHFTRDGNVYT